MPEPGLLPEGAGAGVHWRRPPGAHPDALLRDWWTPEDAEKFIAATDRLAEQISTYEPLPGKHINGRLTLGESIADVAGLTVAYDAFQLYLEGQEPEVIDGCTADQRFFLAYAQMWRWKPRDECLDRQLLALCSFQATEAPVVAHHPQGWTRAAMAPTQSFDV